MLGLVPLRDNCHYFFQPCERAESSKSCNLIGSKSGRYFFPANLGEIVGSFIHKFFCCLWAETDIFKPFFSKICAINSISKGKVNFIIQTKNLKGESSKSAWKTVTWDQALFSFRFVNNVPVGKAKRKESLIQTFHETSAAHFFDWLTFAESANQNHFRYMFF